jgi:hypothetical protein
LAVEALETLTGQAVGEAVTQLAALEMAARSVVTYRSDEEYHAAHPDIPFPASWHRAVIARAALEVPGLAISYSGPAA